MGVKLERTKNAPYEVNYNMGLRPERYIWNPSKGKHASIVEVSDDCYMYLLQSSVTFRDGELRIVEEGKADQDVVEIDEYKANSHSREDVEKLLKGNLNTLKAELNKITNQSELTFFIDVAKELKIEKLSVLKAIAEKVGCDYDILFEDDEDEK